MGNGDRATKPSIDPRKDNHVFTGWDFNFSSSVYSDVTVSALWEKKSWQVSFNLNGGNGSFLTQTVVDGGLATKPTNEPRKDNFVFAGWDFNFSSPVNRNITVKALWEKKSWQVSFNLNGGNGSFPTQTVDDGGLAIKPNNEPRKEKHVFIGWDYNFS